MTDESLTEIRRRLEDHEARLTELEGVIRARPRVQKRLSIKEFLLSKSLETNYEKALAIGYYLENYDGLTCFNVEDLKQGFRNAKETLPGNVNDMLYGNARKGYMMEAKSPKNNLKAYVLTNSGERQVETNFGRQRAQEGRTNAGDSP